MMMFWNGGGWVWWQAGLMWAGMLVFWGLLIWAVYALITSLTRRPGAPHSGGDARRILDGRWLAARSAPRSTSGCAT